MEYGHGLSFRYPVQMLLPCSLNGRVFPDHKAICHYCSKRTRCPDKGMLLESEGDWTIRINPVRAVFELSPMRKGVSDLACGYPLYIGSLVRLLSENRIGKQYLVIDDSSYFHRCLCHHELYAFSFHPCLLHEPVYDEPRRKPCTPFVFPYDEAFVVVSPADVPVARLVVMGEVHPSAAEYSQLN